MCYNVHCTRVHHGRQTHKIGDNFLSDEQVLCIGSSRKRPVLKWEQNTAWPGHLTLTNKALYFEVWIPTQNVWYLFGERILLFGNIHLP